jgi:mannosyltransferase
VETAKRGIVHSSAEASEFVRPRIVVPALTALAAGLGLLHLQYRSVFLEESVSISLARGSWAEIWHAASGGDPNASFFYSLLKLWTEVFGSGLTAVRGLSVLCAALTVPVVYAVGARLFDPIAGMIAAFLVAINAYYLQWAQVVRGYTLVTLLVAVSWYFFLVELERPSRKAEAGYITASVLAFYAHYYAAWLTLVQLGVLLAVRRRAAFTRWWIACYAVIAVLAAPMAVRALTLDHNPLGWLQSPPARALWDISAQLAGDSMRLLVGILGTLALVVVVGVRSPRLYKGLAIAAAWVVVPLFGAFAVSQYKPILANNYLLVCVPGLALLTAGAVTGLRSKVMAGAVLAWLVVVSGPPLRTWYRYPGREDWRDAVAYVEQHQRSGDGIVFRKPIAAVSYGEHTQGGEQPTQVHDSDQGSWSALARVARPRLWVVVAYQEADKEEMRAGLAPTFALVRFKRFEGIPGNWTIAVALFARPRSS